MKSTRNLLVAALAAGGLAMAGSAFAQHSGHSGGGHWSGGHSGGHFSGGHFGGGHFVGHGGHFFGPRFSFFLGVPLLWGPYYWGAPYYAPYYSPYYDGYYGYPDAPAVYQEREVVPYETEPATTQARPGPGAPSQGPLYMNYCASAKAYYPKVTQCPEGWKFIEPSR